MTEKNPNRVRAGKKSKRKGNSNELALVKLFQQWWGHGEWARTPLSGGWGSKEAREGFRTCGDIITTAADFPFCIEAKKQENWTLDQLLHNDGCVLFKWWKQALGETPEGQVPLLVVARNFVPQSIIFSGTQMNRLLSTVDSRRTEGGKFAIDLPGPPWTDWPHMMFANGNLADDGEYPSFAIQSLENFFKSDPHYFGRKKLDVEQSATGPGTGTAEAV